MRTHIFFWTLFIGFFIQTGLGHSQLLVSNNLTPQQLAQLISGTGVQIFNPVVHCGVNGYGKYNAMNSNLNITEGLLLTTGTISNAVGPNDVGNKTSFFGNANTPSTYPLLNNYTGKTTWEYCEFEFDIVPQGDTIAFDFVFASEEYEEWVGSQYNDVFGFFISGPGISGDPGAGAFHNIALLPNSTTPVTINNVNQNKNAAYYQNNNNGTSVQYDGFTKGLKAISRVTPCGTYHLKLVVADVSDKYWDSGVFIEKIVSNNVHLTSLTAGGIPNMVEGCNNGSVVFTRPVVNASPLTIKYWLGGTATNGTDYPLIGNSSSPSDPKTIIIPANQASAYLNINPYADGIAEGTEYLTVYLGNPLCANAIMDSLRFYIQDSLFTTVVPASDSICLGQNKQITTTEGGSSFSWSPSAGLNNTTITNPLAAPSVTTTYTLTTTASTCVMKKLCKINVSNIQLSFNPVQVSCNGANNGSVNLTVNGGFPPYVFSWTGPSSFTSASQNITGLAPGTYSVTVNGKKGCSGSGSVLITQPLLLSATVASPTVNGGYNIACFGSNNGSASVSPSGGTIPFTYSWSTMPVQTGLSASGLTAGTYTVEVKDAKGCALTKTILLTQPALLSTAITSQTNVLCFGNTSGAATVTASGGNSPYVYAWNTSPPQSTPAASNLGAGSYSVTIKDANNCTANQNVVITQPVSILTASVSAKTNVLCYGNSTGSATVVASGGAGVYTYSWNTAPAQVTATATNLGAGSYVVTVNDANGCVLSFPVSITQPASNINATISTQSNVSCFGGNNGSAMVNVSGGVPGYTYSWNTIPSQSLAIATNLNAGSYNVQIKDANNCSYTIQANITQPSSALTAILISQGNVLCTGNATGSVTAGGAGGTPAYTYSWNTNPVQQSAAATGLIAGNYTVTIKDRNNCSTSKLVTVTEPLSPVQASISSRTNVLCFGSHSGSATVSSTGGVGTYSYSWNTLPAQLTASATGLAAGIYTVTVKDLNNCSALAAVTISEPASALGGSITSITPVLCKNDATGSSTVAGSGGSGSYAYSWNSLPVQTIPSATGLTAGTYTVSITDNNGCTTPVHLPVTIPEPASILTASLGSPLFNGYSISCYGAQDGSVSLTPSGGTPLYTYSWTGPAGFVSSGKDISNLIKGIYSVLVNDSHGCTKAYSITLSEPPAINLSAVVTPATCPSFGDGAILLFASGGAPSYSYSWTGPAGFTSSNSTISGLSHGAYTITVTDVNSCSKTAVYTVTQPGTLVITDIVTSYPGGTNISCNNLNNGAVTSVLVSGGTGAITYSWSGPNAYSASTADITSLYAGNYQLQATDAAGCVANKFITLTEPNPITAELTPGAFAGGYMISCNGSSDGTLSASAAGGTPAYSYSWTGPSGYTSSGPSISSLKAGVYVLTVSDLNACIGSNSIILTQPAILSASLASPKFNGGYSVSCNGVHDGSILMNVTGGSASYSYSWSGPSGYVSFDLSPVGLLAGTYSAVVTDANGCTANNSIILTEPDPLVAIATSPMYAGGYNISCSGLKDGTINLMLSGGSPAYTYSWSGSGAYTSGIQNPTGIGAGTYSVIVTDANGCTTPTSLVINQPQPLVATISSPVVSGGYNITCNGAMNGSILFSLSGGASGYSYSWTGPSGYTSSVQNPSGIGAGIYNLTANDANGCIATSTISLTEPASLVLNVSSPTYAGGYNVTCFGLANGAVNVTTGGGTPGYSYTWNGPSGYLSTAQNPSGIGAGAYSVTSTDLNGCAAVSSITLTQPLAITGSLSANFYSGGYNISCNGSSDGSITQVINGGTLPYTILWSTGASSMNLASVKAGAYSVIVADANTCSLTQSITLTEPAPLFAAAVSASYYGGYNIKCHGDASGAIQLGVSGGTSPYSYQWNGPGAYVSNAQNLSGLLAGTYSVSITDHNGCVFVRPVCLTEPAVLAALISSPSVAGGYNVRCNGLSDGSVAAVIAGGTAVYHYSCSGPAGFTSTSCNISSLLAGAYSITVTDTNSCTASGSIILTQPLSIAIAAVPSVFAGGYNVSCFGLSSGSIQLTANGGTPAYTFSWSGPGGFSSSSQTITGLTAGVYSVSITDANSCAASLSDTLKQPSAIVNNLSASIYPGGNNISCYNAGNGSIHLTSSGGANPYTVLWTGPNGFSSTQQNPKIANATGAVTGAYQVIAVLWQRELITWW